MCCSQCQELGQIANLASDWLPGNKEPIRSQVSSLTQLLTLTKTQKFPPQKFAWSNNYSNVRGGNPQQFLAVQISERCPDFHFISNRKSEQVVQKYVFTFSFFSKRKSGRPDFWKGVHIFVFDENQNLNTFPVQICTEKVFRFAI